MNVRNFLGDEMTYTCRKCFHKEQTESAMGAHMRSRHSSATDGETHSTNYADYWSSSSSSASASSSSSDTPSFSGGGGDFGGGGASGDY